MADESKAAGEEAKGDGCCPAGSHPELVLDTAREVAGKEVALSSGLNTYQVGAEDATRAIIIIYDVFGFSGGRIKGVCDSVAEAGYFVVMPDVYGDSNGVQDFGGFASDTGKAFLKQFTWERLEKNLKEVQAEVLAPRTSIKSVGALGFCWGGWVMFKMSGAGMITAGASCHPSPQVGKYLFDEELEALTDAASTSCPIQLCPAGNDGDFVQAGGSVQKALEARGISCDVTAFPDMKHGWVPRGDATEPAIARDVGKALKLCTDFFAANLA